MIALILEVYGALCLFSLITFLVWAWVAKLRPDLDELESDLDELETLEQLAGEQSAAEPEVGDLMYEERPPTDPAPQHEMHAS